MAAGLGFATAATLILEIVLTRIFSVILWYHYGFMTISLALLGLGLAGVLVYLYPERFPRERAARLTARVSLVFAGSIVAAILFFHWIVSVGEHWPLGAGYRTLVFVTTLVPFFFGGLVVAIPISRYTERIGTLYAADLAGAAVGALLVVPLIGFLGGYPVVLACSGLAAAAATCFAASVGRRRTLALGVVGLAISVAVVPAAVRTDFFRIRYAKDSIELEVLAERWNSFSRVTVHSEVGRPFGWNLGSGVTDRRHGYRPIEIDGHAMTPMLSFDGDLESLRYLGRDVSSLGYQVRPQRSALVIGAGGGRDILTAKLFGVSEVHAVEINPIVVDFARRTFREYTGNPYDLPGVSTAIVDGRNYVARTQERFDHIQLSAVDTTAALAAGALSLVENSLYTVEAFEDYHDHLTEEGLLSITRNWTEETQMMALRTADLVRTAWANRGHEDPRRHLVIVAPETGTSRWGTLLASRRPFTETELERTRLRAAELGFEILYEPDGRTNPRAFDELFGPGRERFLRDYPYDVAATTDDRPYFFFFLKPFRLGRRASDYEGEQTLKWASRVTPRILVQAFALVASLVVVLAFLVPILLGRLRFGAVRGAGPGLLYFAAIGLGFIMVEIALIQRHTLVLGHPLYAFSGILGCVLVFSGLGSLVSHSVADHRVPRVAIGVVIVTLALVLVHAFLVPSALHAAMRYPLPVRTLATVASVAPLGFFMGMPLPLGMRMLERRCPRALAWAWGVNGSLSVTGTVLAVFVSVFFGITAAMTVGGLVYLLTLPLAARAVRP